MKTDRELLELAAKAAGVKARWFNVKQWRETPSAKLFTGTKPVFGTHHSKPWNPLADDGDALRLAVKLGLCVQPACSDDYDRAYAAVYLFDDCGQEVLSLREPYGEGVPHLFATRRAIVRAAAVIGETSK